MTPNRRTSLEAIVRHGENITDESNFHGSASVISCINNFRSLADRANGPAQGLIPVNPPREELVWPPYGMRSAEGRNAYVPLQMAGIRIDPAMSVPTPSTDPPMAIKAPSPPDEPPAVRFDRWGLSVRPNT